MVFLSSQDAFALNSFQRNIDKKISKGRSVSRILDRRFSYEIKRKKVDYPLLLWINSRIKKDKDVKSNDIYFRNAAKYLDRCLEEADFSDCLSIATRLLPFIFSIDTIYKKVTQKNKALTPSEFSSLLGLFFYFPNLNNNKMFQYLNSLYSEDSSLLENREYLNVFLQPQLIVDDKYIDSLKIKMIQSIYRLSAGVTEEVQAQCKEDLQWSGEKFFPIFSLCILNLAKSDKKKAKKILMANKKVAQSDPWFQLMCEYLTKGCLLERELSFLRNNAKNGSAFSFYLNALKNNEDYLRNNQMQMGMAFLFFELKALR